MRQAMGRRWLPVLLAISAASAWAAAPGGPFAAQPSRQEPIPVTAPPDKPLSPAEADLQGRWQGFDARSGSRAWSLEVAGRAFRAAGLGEWYEGRLVVRGDRQPAWIDFVIERCRCAYEGTTSEGVFDRDDDSLGVAAAAPGNPRPASLDDRAAQLLRFEPR